MESDIYVVSLHLNYEGSTIVSAHTTLAQATEVALSKGTKTGRLDKVADGVWEAELTAHHGFLADRVVIERVRLFDATRD